MGDRTLYRQNNRHKNYSVRQGNDTQTYKHGPQTSSRITDNYSVTKSDGYSANSSGKVTSKNNQESYSENKIQNESEYKVDAYTTTSRGDDQTITSTRSTSNNDGTNNTSSSSSDTVRTQNSQTVTVYKDGLKNENEGSSYQRWWNETATDRGVTATTNGYESWSSSYSRSQFKGGYSWSETISGTNSESVTKGGTNTSKRSDWSWTRGGTVWDDGRNSWSESWSKSNWENGRSVPGESETTRGSYNPKGTGTQTNNLPKAGEAPRLNKPPKNVVDLNKQPKHKPQPSKELFERPVSYDKKLADNFPQEEPIAQAPPPAWPPKDIGSYWLSYSGTLNTTPQQRRQIFRDIINNPSIKKVYMNVLSTQGTTFKYGDGLGNMIPGLSGQDVFAEFKDELDRYNSAHPNKRRDIEVIGWFEGSGLAAPSSPIYKAAQKARYSSVPGKNAVLSHKGDGGLSYVDLLHPNVWGELQNIATDFINKYGSFVKGIIFDDRLEIPSAAEQEVANLHRSTITADKDSNDKSWIQRALTNNLANLKKALPSTRFSISANLLRYALNDQNQDVLNWLKSGIINGEYNLQLYKNGAQYNDFVKNYQEHMARLVDKEGITRDRLSVSIGYIALGVPLTRDQIRQQVNYLTNTSTKPLSPSQILGFDYRKIADIK